MSNSVNGLASTLLNPTSSFFPCSALTPVRKKPKLTPPLDSNPKLMVNPRLLDLKDFRFDLMFSVLRKNYSQFPSGGLNKRKMKKINLYEEKRSYKSYIIMHNYQPL